MNKLTREEIERIGNVYFILTYAEYSDSLALSHEDATRIVWDMVQSLRLNCTRHKLDEIIHYWKQVEDIEEDCQLGIVCTYVLNGGSVPEEHELEPYLGG